RLPDWSTARIGGQERIGGEVDLPATDHLVEFRLEAGVPVWRFEGRGFIFEKRVWLPHQQNTVYVNYRLVEGSGPLRLKVRPSVHFRGHDDPVGNVRMLPYTLTAVGERYELSATPQLPTLRL